MHEFILTFIAAFILLFGLVVFICHTWKNYRLTGKSAKAIRAIIKEHGYNEDMFDALLLLLRAEERDIRRLLVLVTIFLISTCMGIDLLISIYPH